MKIGVLDSHVYEVMAANDNSAVGVRGKQEGNFCCDIFERYSEVYSTLINYSCA